MKKVEGYRSENVQEGPSIGLSEECARRYAAAMVVERINEATDMESLLHGVLEALVKFFQFDTRLLVRIRRSADHHRQSWFW